MRGVRVAAWSLWAAFVVTFVVAAYFGFNPRVGEPTSVVDAIWAASFIGFPTAGALIVPRMPRRPLGWVLLIAPLLLILGVALSDAARQFTQNPSYKVWTLWLASVCFGAGFGPLLTIPLYLPNGHLPSPRWRWVGRAVWTMVVISLFHSALRPGPLADASSGIPNPLGIETDGGLFDLIEAALGPAFLVTIATGVLSLFVRYRRSKGPQRQQMKWLAVGGLGLLLSFGSIAVIESVFRDLTDTEVTLFIVVGILSLPTSIAVAVLKTRLYDVDVVINRTLVYAGLTAILGLFYFGVVVTLQRLLEPLTKDSDVAIAASTLAVAALARPARARLQEFIDRRFYRRKYDASKTLEDFSARLRDQVDLDSLTKELLGVVGSTMQPSHASVWLRAGVAS